MTKSQKRYLAWSIVSLIVLTIGVIYALISPYTRQSITHPVWYTTEGQVAVWGKYQSRDVIDEVPEWLQEMIVSVEDHRIYNHVWIDFYSLFGAIRHTVTQPTRRWASTVSQQVVKIDRGHRSRSISNKLREMWYALKITEQYGAESIILRYVNTVPFPYGVQWRKGACIRYRNQECGSLSQQKQRILLMMSQRWLDPYNAKHQKKIIERIYMYQRVRPDLFDPNEVVDTSVFAALSSVDDALDPRVQDLIQLVNPVYSTSFDTQLYQEIENTLTQTHSFRARYNANNCCVVVLDEHDNLRSANSCTAWTHRTEWKINACLIPRQTGSVVKPFVYAYALEQLGYTPTDTILDAPTEYLLADGSVYAPKNFDLTHHGEVSLSYALGNSLNVPAVKLVSEIGAASFLEYLQSIERTYASQVPDSQYTSHDLWLSIALGTYPMSPLTMAQIWRSFAYPHHQDTPAPAQVLSILEDYQHKVVSFGQDSFLDTPGWAIKTWTSRHFVDGWICGFHGSSQQSICIWLWNFDNQPMKWSSSEVASFIWSEIVDDWERVRM